MPPRYVCRSMGALRRSISCDVAALSNRCSRSFHASTRRLEDPPKAASTPSPAAPANERQPRRARNASAAGQIARLPSRRLPSQQGAREGQDSAPKTIQPRKPLLARRPSAAPTAQDGAPPGTMVRAPSKLRITRNAPGTSPRGGPNLRGRGPGNRGAEATPKRRERKEGGKGPNPTRLNEEVKTEDTLSDGMVQQLLRLQRKEWDRVPYTPKYAPGSFEASELIHAGRELFKGEAPPVKIWGPLEKQLNIVGMHNAEAHLEVKRVRTGKGKQSFYEKVQGQVSEPKTEALKV